jgi:hypothetical protein
VSNYALVLLVDSWKESGDVDEGEDGDIEGVAESYEPGGFD